MKITRLVEDGKSKTRIFIDDEYAGTLWNRELFANFIEADGEITEEAWSRIEKEIILPRGKKKALDLLLFQERAEKELFDKLISSGYTQAQTSLIMDYVKQYPYLDDVRYAMHYMESVTTTKSARQIRFALKEKGVSDRDVETAYQCFEEQRREEQNQADGELSCEEPELEAIRMAVRKKFRNRTAYEENDFVKLFQSLARKGFRAENIKRVFEEMKQDLDE